MLEFLTGNFRYNGKDRFDITVKSGNPAFSPTWDMVMGIKNGTLSQEDYTKLYYAKMRKSYLSQRQEWENLLNMEKVVLVCFCKPDDFCHRRLLADILVKLGAFYLGEL